MTPANHREASLTLGHDAADEMAKSASREFLYKEYRYTSLADAIAQAKRQHPAVPSDGRERSGSR
jgi:hypothetical protein